MLLKDKKVLITGATGFIGSHLTSRVLREGADVYILTRYKCIEKSVRLVDIWDKINVIEADIRNIDSLKKIREIKPHIIFHLAAYNHVGDSFIHVNEALKTNCIGTANLMEAYEAYERFIYISSSEVYGYQNEAPFKETSLPQPISPYGIGKYAGELYCNMKMKMQNFPIVILRPFNTFGPYQSARAIIPEIIIKCLRGDSIESTEGKQTREFNYIDNQVDGFIKATLIEKAIGKIINIGSSKDISIRDLILKIHSLTGSKSELKIGALKYRPTEIWQMYCANKKAKGILEWEPKISFETGLEKTISWFKEFLKQYNSSDSPLAKLLRLMDV
jgi:nucleoside-diphosphate-sugar epimerase